MSIGTVIGRGIANLQNVGMGDQLLQQLGREGFLLGSLSHLESPASLERIHSEDRKMIEGIISALLRGGPGIPEDTAPRDHYVMTSRPLKLDSVQDFAKARFRLFDPSVPETNGLTVVRGETPRYLPPPDIRLDSQHYLDVLQILEYAGVHYTDPRAPAAGQGFATFLAARNYALERLEKMEGTGRSLDWIGFDWDFTADVYRIYGEILPLISMKLFHEPPKDADKKYIRVLEAAKPGMHEIIVGLMAAYAAHQGLLLFSEWEHYRPQVRIVTQTWPERLMVLGNDYMRLLPLLMGRLPGLRYDVSAVNTSQAFITLHDFLREAGNLLDAYRESGFRLEALTPEDRNDLVAILRTGKGHVIKSLAAFEAKDWTRPGLLFDDGPVTNARLRRSGVPVVQVLNPLARGKEMSDLKVVTLRGRKTAFRQMLRMLSRTEAPALTEWFTDPAEDHPDFDVVPEALQKTPEGAVVTIHDTWRSLDRFFTEFEAPKRRLKKRIREVIDEAGGMKAIERNYREAVAFSDRP